MQKITAGKTSELRWTELSGDIMEDKALVVIPEIDFKGGGERVSYKAAQKLAEEDVSVDILTNVFFTGKENVEEVLYDTYGHSEQFESNLEDIHTIESSRVKKFVRAKYKEAFQWARASELHDENSYDYIFTHYSNIHFMPEFEGAEVIYYLGPGPENDPGLKRKILEAGYLTPYWLANRFVGRNPPEKYSFVVNSRFSREKFSERFPEIDFRVVYPPVDTESFQYGGEEKENMIVNFSRISPDKRNNLLIEVADELSQELEDYRFKIVGAVRGSEEGYLEALREDIEERGLEDMVDIEANVSFQELTQTLKKSMVNLHLAKGESFGMTPVESLAAGNNLVVHRSGAPWKDIVKEGKYGEGWEDKEELVQKTLELADKESSQQNVERANDFSEEKFKSEIESLFDL